MEKLDKFISKIGVDKVLHFLVGALISFIIITICIFYIGIVDNNIIWLSIIAVFITFAIELIKEYILDEIADIKDIVATLIGSIIPLFIAIVGMLLRIII